ncbi:hypothetical protein HaLaN_27152 [Haematococcus lacustris]|uniref:Uncharacterized protein n=1 Tax=Haematococcus lacustris TaxID=44745 RepID=A0A6A0A7X1_HAELA|nr:hypothetical protein HaLaN_27152 [Haematococcus lacustris]
MRAMRPSSRFPDVKTHKTAGSRTARTAARVAAAAPTAEAQAYQQLLSYANIQTCLSLVSTPHGNGLATDMSVKKGQGLCYLSSQQFACNKHPAPIPDSLPQPTCEGRAINVGMKHML